MTWRHYLLCCFLLVAVTLFGSAGGVAVDPAETRIDAQQDTSAPLLVQEDIDADSVLMQAQINESGDAHWELQYRLRLDTDEQRQAFEGLETDIEQNTSAYLGPFENRLTDTVSTAESATAREMSADGFAVSTQRESQPQAEFGLITFEFEWSGFVAVTDDQIRAGDALDQLFLEDDQRLQFDWPDGYQLDSTTPEPAVSEQHRVVWRGPVEFAAGQPRIVLSPIEEDFSFVFITAGGLAVLAIAGAYWWYRRDQSHDQPSGAVPAGTDGAGGADETATSEISETSEVPAAAPPPELLSNQERLLQLLQENGGRMKQQAVAEELDWSAAKTSQIVGDLRDDDQIESFRLGRENILTLPDVDIVEDDVE